MAEDRKYQQHTAPQKRRASRSVYFFDRLANVVIRVGGLFVVFSVLGLVAFVFSEAFPLFGSSEYGAVEQKMLDRPGRTHYIGCDEYRRVAIRVGDGSDIEFFSLLTGETLHRVPVPGLGGASITAASVTLAPYASGLHEGLANVPRYAFALGTSDGRIVGGHLMYLTDFKRFELGSVPKELEALKMPSEDDRKRSSYIPDVLVFEREGHKWIAEHMPEFGFYRFVRGEAAFTRTVDIPTGGEAIESVHVAMQRGEPDSELETLTAVITTGGRALFSVEKLAVNGMTGEVQPELVKTYDATAHIDGRARFVLAHELRTEVLFATAGGLLHTFRLGVNPAKPEEWEPTHPGINVLGFNAGEGRDWRETAGSLRDDGTQPQGKLELTAMSWLLGGSTVLLGDSYGGVQAWSPVRVIDEDRNPAYRRIRALPSGSGAIRGFSSAQTAKAFAVWDDGGRVRAIYNTSERVFFDARMEGELPVAGYFCPKTDGIVCLDARGKPHHWWVDKGHAEVSFKSLFGKVFYEGYMEPRYEWQSHAGTDDVEQKMSLMPLILGSIKGGLYALLFALPLAVLGAVYTSEFMSPRLRGVIKPSMEVMASLPSVVLGFLGALYFAPMAAPRMPMLLVFVLLAPTLFMLFGWIFGQLPPYVTKRFGPVTTSISLAAILLAGVLLSATLGPRLESHIFPAVEGANPALLDSKTFKPINDDTAKAYAAGNFRAWTDGGRELPRPMTTNDGVALPKGWWIPGGHNLFSTLMLLPFALLAGLGLKVLHAFLFGGRALGRDFSRRLAFGSPLTALRNALAGKSAGMRPVLVDVFAALGTAGVALLLGWGLSALVSSGIESLLFSYDHPTAGRVADFRRWVTGPAGWTFTQTNSLIVGFAMGFAVIPIIYSIAEDALSTVPNQMRAASLACGASRWQTAVRVVVPAAASGIFSAIVIGLGRALGETMIVVMAAGGTPVNDLQPLNGFRSLSAAIAIEMPEASHGSTHYRTLFLCGLILFLMTFVISTLAEFVRMRLRRKLSRM